MPNHYMVNEIFYSIQGEGQWVGQPMAFVRFSGCNLNCNFCDTDHRKATRMTAVQILQAVHDCLPPTISHEVFYKVPICLTGGEPTLQVDQNLLWTLNDHPLHMETNGTEEIDNWSMFRCITFSPKRSEVPLKIREMLMCGDGARWELKVVCDPASIEFQPIIQETWGRLRFSRKYLQPMAGPYGGHWSEEWARSFIADNPDWGLSVQLHKILKIR